MSDENKLVQRVPTARDLIGLNVSVGDREGKIIEALYKATHSWLVLIEFENRTHYTGLFNSADQYVWEVSK